MERLRRRDLDALSSCLRELYSYRSLEEFRSSIVKAIPAVIPSDRISYNEIELRNQKNILITEPAPPDFPELYKAFARRMDEHPYIEHYRRTGDGRARRISDFLTQREFRRLRLYNEYYRKVGIDHSLVVSLSDAPSQLGGGIAFGRSGKDFSGRDRLLLDTFRPHLVQARQNAKAAERNQLDSQNLHQAVEELDRGIIYLSEDGRVEMVTERARRLLPAYFGPLEGTDGLPEVLRRWVERQHSARSGNGDAPPIRKPLVVESGSGKLVVRLVADKAQDGRQLLLLEEQAPPVSTDDLAPLLGLTRREGEILHLVARGDTDQQIAAALYVSPRTVGKHLENIYSKLGVSGRAEAVSKAMEVAGPIRR